MNSPVPETASVNVLVYSQRPELRRALMLAVGRRPAPELPQIRWHECSSYAQVRQLFDTGEIALGILDGDAQPTGGVGLVRQFKNELVPCPPLMVILLREVDRWLAAWSQADGVIVQPIDPVAAAAAVAGLLRSAASAPAPAC